MPESSIVVFLQTFAAAHPFITAAAVIGANLVLGRVLAPKFDTAGNPNPDKSRNITARATTAPRRTIYGTVRTAGYLVTVGAADSDADDLYEVHDFCHHEIESFDFVTIKNIEIDLSTDLDGSGWCTLDAFKDGDGNKLLQIITREGTDTQTTPTELSSAFANIDSNFRGRGIAYIMFLFRLDRSDGGPGPVYDPDVWEAGKPENIQATIRGKKIYNPALDGSRLGTGSHRWEDQTTWEHSSNPSLIRRDYLTDGNGEVTTGQATAHHFGESNANIDDAAVIAAAAIDDETVTVWSNDGLGGTTTQNRYTCDGVMLAGGDLEPDMTALNSSCAGGVVRQGQVWVIWSGAYTTPTVTFDEDSLGGPYTLTQGAGSRDRVNTVAGIYYDPTRGEELSESQYMTLAADVTTDGEERPVKIQLPFTRDEMTAQRLALIEQRLGRMGGEFSVTMNLAGLQIGVNDIVYWTLAELSFTAEPFRCISWELSNNGTIRAGFVRDAASVWTYDPPPAPSDLIEIARGPQLANTADPPGAPTALTATTSRNGVRLAWTNASLIDVLTVEVWAATSNDRAHGSFAKVGNTLGDAFEHHTDYGDTWYYWLIAQGRNYRASAWHPSGATSGVTAVSGNTGDGLSATLSKDAATVTVNGSWVGNLAAAQGVLTVYRGGIDITATATVTATGSNCTAQYNDTLDENFTGPAGGYRITAISGVDAEIQFSIEDGTDSIDIIFDITAIVVTTPAFSAVIGGGGLYSTVSNGSQTTAESKTCIAANGVTTYSYVWSRVSGDTAITAASSTSATTAFSSNGTNQLYTAVFKCQVTDSDSPPVVIDSNNVTISIQHGTLP